MRALIPICFALAWANVAASAELAESEQQAIAAAVAAAEKAVVQIRTVGGADQIDGQLLAQGPTTGLIVSEDGLIVSSAFNFAQEPTSILVRLPDGRQRPAHVVGRDDNRMLVLLKVETSDRLPVAEEAPLGEVRPGDWAIALGRTYDPRQASVSVGIVSALRRMHGRAIQTDANVSAANYGGPLIDLQGRTLGVLVPMAPQTSGSSETDATAGAEFYDSGIGFAVPLTHILDVLDRWIEEEHLRRGLLGIGMKPGNPHSTAPIITHVWPRSPAALAGWREGDRIVAINGQPVDTQTELRFQTIPRYAGDVLKATIRRGAGEKAREIETEAHLAAELPPYVHPFLGVLPVRESANGNVAAGEGDSDDDEPSADEANEKPPTGLAIRSVWPDSPADEAGLQAGDRLVQLGGEPVASLSAAIAQLNAKSPGDKLAVVAKRGEEERQLEVQLAELPEDVLGAADLPNGADDSSNSAALGDPQLRSLKLPEMPQTARYLQPSGAGPAPGLLVWLGAGANPAKQAESVAAAWQRPCARDRMILLLPEPADAGGWTNDDLEYLARLLQTAIGRWRLDPRRIIVGGEGKGGQLAYALALQGRKLVRGVAVVDSPLPRTLNVPANSPGERLAVLSVETQNTPLSLLIRSDLQKLKTAGYPVTQIVRRGEESRGPALDGAVRDKISRWIDGLDRL